MRTLKNASSVFGMSALAFAIFTPALAAKPFKLDADSSQQAELEKKVLADGSQRSLVPALAEFRKTAEKIEYPNGDLKLPGYLYKPAGKGPFPAVIWNHGSEKMPTAQVELARFYTEHGFVFFLPIREGHGDAPGEYIVDLQQKLRETETSQEAINQKIVALHDRFNADVVAAVAWLKQQPFVDADRIVMSGCSYGGIQTLLSAEKGLGVRAFVPFSPGAMSWANTSLQTRLRQAAQNAKAPVLLIQAKNDFSTGPSEHLGPILKQLGAPSGSNLYDAFGSSPGQGHGAFACWSLGTQIWGNDVLQFLDAAQKNRASQK
jgi:carboxymethylenebutenolidase